MTHCMAIALWPSSCTAFGSPVPLSKLSVLTSRTLAALDLTQIGDSREKHRVSRIDIKNRPKTIESVMPSRNWTNGRCSRFPNVLEYRASLRHRRLRHRRLRQPRTPSTITRLTDGHRLASHLLPSLSATCHGLDPHPVLRRTEPAEPQVFCLLLVRKV
jgi:hypothetical protein